MVRSRACRTAFALCLVLSILLAGSCKKGTEPPAAATGAVSRGTTGEKPLAAEGMQIAVVPKGTEHTFWLTVKAGAEDAAKEVGAKVIWRGPASEQDVMGQIQIIENFTASGVDAIVMAACDSKDLIAPLAKAKEKGILIATIDSGIDDPDLPITYAATDNVLGGKRAGEVLAGLVGREGVVAVIPFIQGAKSSDDRERGFTEEIARNPKIRLLPPLYSQSQVDTAAKVTENLLTANPDLVGIFAANEPGVIGAARVIAERGLAGKVKLVGYDASADEIEALRRGVVQALIVQDPYKMGYSGVMAVVKAKLGQTVPRLIDTGVTVVTADNVDSPQVQALLAQGKS